MRRVFTISGEVKPETVSVTEAKKNVAFRKVYCDYEDLTENAGISRANESWRWRRARKK